MPAPILNDALIDRVLREQRQHLRPPSGWGCSAWTLRAEQARDPEQLLTVADTASHIGAHEQTVRLWIKRGELKASKFGTRIGYRIRRADYDAFLARRSMTSTICRNLLMTADPPV
jgi:excisionase family DNA binding protein